MPAKWLNFQDDVSGKTFTVTSAKAKLSEDYSFGSSKTAMQSIRPAWLCFYVVLKPCQTSKINDMRAVFADIMDCDA